MPPVCVLVPEQHVRADREAVGVGAGGDECRVWAGKSCRFETKWGGGVSGGWLNWGGSVWGGV